MLFSTYIEQFLSFQEKSDNSAGEMAQKRMALANHLVPFFGATELADITEEMVLDYKAAKKAEPLAPRTINNHLNCLRRLLNQAVEHKHMAKAPKVKLLPQPIDEPRHLDATEANALVRAADKLRNPIYRQMMIVAMHTGMRVGELLALHWANVDMVRNRVFIRESWCRTAEKAKVPKSGKGRHVMLTPVAVAAFRSVAMGRETPSGRVFDCNYDAALKAIWHAAEMAGLEDVSWHTLRHTFASLLVEQGVAIYTIKELLGHSSLKMTERYLHLNDDTKKDAARMLDKALAI